MTFRPPCTLKRQDCLFGDELMNALGSQTITNPTSQIACTTISDPNDLQQDVIITHNGQPRPCTPFESLLLKPPILDALLLHLPTGSLFDLYHTSKFLNEYLRNYPLAWKNLSFRLLPAATPVSNGSGLDSPTESSASKRPHALDFLLRYALPQKTSIRLTRLDLDNTSVSGTQLHTNILDPLRSVLQHLSVRGCKEVSIKYHILPFLTENLTAPADQIEGPLALKSLYTYRCRHHRRRPYLPSSLNRRDSDSHPTHQLIEVCHRFGIWTDTAWCPTPGGRCFRRKDYWIGRSGFGASEVWVPFDRLWRSQNFIGPTEDLPESRGRERYARRDPDSGSVGRLWAEQECGHGGEPLGSGIGTNPDGKELPAHERRSHKAFISGFRCDGCGDPILERCEQCSVRMHCSGCRKTLCHSCAFDRPFRKRRRRELEATVDGTSSVSPLDSNANLAGDISRRRPRRPAHERYWWAPGAVRSPNIMSESTQSDDSASDEEGGSQHDQVTTNPRLDMHWCCLKPTFSGGGGIGFMGTPNGDNVRAAPLPQGRGFEDADFAIRSKTSSHSEHSRTSPPQESRQSCDTQSHPALLNVPDTALFNALSSPLPPYQNISQPHKAPRSLCNDCYNSPAWRVTCKACNMPICIEHDIKQLKARRCGFRKLDQERKVLQQVQSLQRDEAVVNKGLRDANLRIFLAKWRPIVASMEADDERRRQDQKWVPEESHDIDSLDDLESPVSPPTDAPYHAHQLRRTKSLTTLPSYTHLSKPLPTVSPPSPSPGRAHAPRWLGCGAYLCPSPRALGDPRPRCTASETSNAAPAPTTTQQPGNNAVSTVTATTNFAAHVANHHPNAMPFVANMGALGNMTLAPGTTMTFLYGPGFATNQPQAAPPQPNQQPLPQGQLPQTQAQQPPAPVANMGTALQIGQPAAQQISAIIAHAAGPQQHVRGGVIHASTGHNEHEALRCAGCNVLVCGDCRRGSPCCPCSACSPALTSTSYAQAATSATPAASANAANSNVTLAQAAQTNNTTLPTQATQAAQSNVAPSTTASPPVATSTPPSIDQFTAQQLCPNCRINPVITARCRFALETSKALEIMSQVSLPSASELSGDTPVSSAATDDQDEDEVGKMVEDGSWSDFWATLGEEPAFEEDHVAELPGSQETEVTNANETTPPPAPVLLSAPTMEVEPPVNDEELEAAVEELIADFVAEDVGDEAGDESSAEGTVDDTVLEEDIMGLEG